MALSLLNGVSILRRTCSACLRFQQTKQHLSASSTQTDSHIPVEVQSPDIPVAPEDTERSLPQLISRKFAHPTVLPPKQAWLDCLDSSQEEKLGIVDLHPEIFAVFPRIDIMWWNIYWQSLYKKVNYDFARSRAEMPGGGRKPWPQKGTGKARHGSVRSPLFNKGGKSFGPRGPKTYFFMLPLNMRVLGLRTALTIKYAQNNLHIVENLDLPSSEPEYLMNLVESKEWGLSVLFVDDTDFIPQNIAIATDEIKQYNVMPVYGLNVHSMLKHETIVLSLAALEKIEERLLFHMNSVNHRDRSFKDFHGGPKV